MDQMTDQGGDPSTDDLMPPGDDAMGAAAPQMDPENLVSTLMAKEDTAAWLKKKTSETVRHIKEDDESRKGWLEMREDQTALYVGLPQTMQYPATGGRAPHDPIIARTLLQIWTRGCEQIVPIKGSLVQVTGIGPEDDDQAKRRETHMNWQLRHKVPNYVAGHRESFFQYIGSGSVFREKSYDSVLKTTRFDHLTPDDVIVSYARKDMDPLMRRVPRVTRVLRYYRWEMEQIEDAGTYPPGTVEKLYSKNSGASGVEDKSKLTEQSEEIDGVKPSQVISLSGDADSIQRLIYRCHMWVTLPGEHRQTAVTLTADVATMLPLDLRIREEEDPYDRARFDAESKVHEISTQNTMTQYQTLMSGWQQASQQAQQMGQPPPPQPPQPQMPPAPAPIKTRPAFNMIHYRLFPNPHGFYGIGIAYLLTNANELVNRLEAEYLNASRLQNMKQGFLPKDTMTKRGEIRLEMGKFTQTDLEPEQMQGIRSFDFGGPSEGLWKFIQKVKEDASTLIADVDTLTGQAGPTNETKAAAMSRQSNATALMTAVASIYAETMAEEPKMLARDNGRYMDEHEPYWITQDAADDPDQQAKTGQDGRIPAVAHREDYASEFDFTLTADQRLQTQTERIQNANSVVDRLMNSPYKDDPAGKPLFYVGFTNLFKAMELPEFQKALGPPPQSPAPPPQPAPMSQEDEIQQFFNDKDHPVLPDDNDEDHLMVIDDFEQSPYAKEMSSTGKQMLARHKASHFGQLYKKTTAQHPGDQANGQLQAPGGTPGGTGGMVPGPGNGIPPMGATPGGGQGAATPGLPQ